ncbi:MAG TPA: radical SAM protein [Bacillota bacterium]
MAPALPERRPDYQPVSVRSVVNRVDNMPFRWSLNPYRGCTHSCIYCYARPTHQYLGFDDPADFDRRIMVKENAVDALRRQLSHPRWRRERIAIGTVTDPYQPAERRFRLTRALLEVMVEFANPVSITTKSPLVVRDLDLLRRLAAGPGCSVNVSVTTLQDDIWRVIEPGTPHPQHRLKAVRILREAGIEAGVLVAPVLPGLTDRRGRLEAVIAAAARAGACWVAPIVLRLPPGVRQWCLARLQEAYPALASAYARAYTGVYAQPRYVRALERRVDRLAAAYGIVRNARSNPAGESEPEQLRLVLAGT